MNIRGRARFLSNPNLIYLVLETGQWIREEPKIKGKANVKAHKRERRRERELQANATA